MLGLLRAVQSEPQRQALDQLLVLGTLLEGHADHVMDAVGPAVVPTVTTIRRRFDERRNRKQPPLQRLVRALLGFDAKLQPVHPRQGVRRPCRRPGRDGAVQHHLDESRNPAAANRDRRARSDGSTGCCSDSCARRSRRSSGVPRRRRDRWCVALSGGPDSLALTAVAATVLPTTALIVDHGLQPDSAAVAATARDAGIVVGMR